MTVEEYYTPPSNEVFEDVKSAATTLWNTYDEPESVKYREEKIGRIKDLENYGDNTAYIIRMFDFQNKMKLYKLLTLESSKKYFKDLMEEEFNLLFVNL